MSNKYIRFDVRCIFGCLFISHHKNILSYLQNFFEAELPFIAVKRVVNYKVCGISYRSKSESITHVNNCLYEYC